MTKNYPEFPDLTDVYLEDSYVLGISETPGTVVFSLDLVLTPGHPRYQAPPPDEQYCYAKAELVFAEVTGVRWPRRSDLTFTDAAGEVDLGNIDTMVYRNDHYELTGDWGEVHIYTTQPPRLTFG
ncbi:hypothetical protein [Amycolatopsis dongchuanensis]|uniref:Head-to-tail stopper n=1 Tax=Amycolatopsis dongchuanensis TaxID=1070866 RepID=A0ABP9PTQ8_9PSEU